MVQTLLYKELLEIIHFSFWCVFKASNTKTWERISWFKFEFIHNNGCGDRAAGRWGDFFPGEFGQMCCCVVNYRPSWKPVLQLLAAPCLKLQRLNLKPRSCWMSAGWVWLLTSVRRSLWTLWVMYTWMLPAADVMWVCGGQCHLLCVADTNALEKTIRRAGSDRGMTSTHQWRYSVI